MRVKRGRGKNIPIEERIEDTPVLLTALIVLLCIIADETSILSSLARLFLRDVFGLKIDSDTDGDIRIEEV